MTNATENISVFGEEKHVFHREFGAGYYKLTPFLLSKFTSELPFQIIIPIIRVAIIYFAVGLRSDTSAFFILCGIAILTSCVGMTLGMAIACQFENIQIALVALPLIILPMMIFSGFFINENSIPIWLDWAKYVTPIKYSFEAMLKNEFDPNSAVGSVVINAIGENDGLTIDICVAILGGFTGFFIIFASYALYRSVYK